MLASVVVVPALETEVRSALEAETGHCLLGNGRNASSSFSLFHVHPLVGLASANSVEQQAGIVPPLFEA